MPNQAPAQLNHSFTHSFTLNNNNLTLFGFLSHFCCLSLSLSLSFVGRPLSPLSPLREEEEGRKGTTSVAITEGKAASPPLSQTDPTAVVLASSARPSPYAKGALFATIRRSGGGVSGGSARLEAPSKTRTGMRKEGKEKGPPARAVVCGEDGSVVARKDGRGRTGLSF